MTVSILMSISTQMIKSTVKTILDMEKFYDENKVSWQPSALIPCCHPLLAHCAESQWPLLFPQTK